MKHLRQHHSWHRIGLCLAAIGLWLLLGPVLEAQDKEASAEVKTAPAVKTVEGKTAPPVKPVEGKAALAAKPVEGKAALAAKPVEGKAAHASKATLAAHQEKLAVISREFDTFLEHYLTKYLERYIEKREYQLDVRTEVKESALLPNIPYLGGELSTVILNNSDHTFIGKHINKIALTLALVPKYGTDDKKTFRKLLIDRLADINVTTADVKIETLHLNSQSGRGAFEVELINAHNEKLSYQQQLKDWEIKGRKLGDELALMKEKLEQTQGKLTDTTHALKKSEDETTTIRREAGKPNFWNIGTWLIMGLLFAVSNIGIALAMHFIGNNLQHFGSGLSVAIEQVGGAISQVASGFGEGRGDAHGALTTAAADNGMPPDAVRNQLLELHEEILGMIEEPDEATVLVYLSHLLNNSEQQKAVHTMEFLGKDMANRLFAKLPKHHQATVLATISYQAYSTQKMLLLLAAGEELKSALLRAGFCAFSGHHSLEVSNRLARIEGEQLIKVIIELENEHQLALFGMLSHGELAQALGLLKKLDADQFDYVVKNLPRIPHIVLDPAAEAGLIRFLDEKIHDIEVDQSVSSLRFVEKVVRAADDTLADELINGMASDRRLAYHFKHNYIRFETLLTMTDGARQIVYEQLKIKELAYVLKYLPEELRERALAGCDGIKRTLVEEELSTLGKYTDKQNLNEFVKIKRRVVDELNKMQKEHLLTFREEEEPPVTQENSPLPQAA